MKLTDVKPHSLSREDIEEYQYLIDKISYIKKKLLDINNELWMTSVKIYQRENNIPNKTIKDDIELYLKGWDGAFPKTGVYHLYYGVFSRDFDNTYVENFINNLYSIIEHRLDGIEVCITGFKLYTDDNLLEIDVQPSHIKQYLFIRKQDQHLVTQYQQTFEKIVDFFKQHQL